VHTFCFAASINSQFSNNVQPLLIHVTSSLFTYYSLFKVIQHCKSSQLQYRMLLCEDVNIPQRNIVGIAFFICEIFVNERLIAREDNSSRLTASLTS